MRRIVALLLGAFLSTPPVGAGAQDAIVTFADGGSARGRVAFRTAVQMASGSIEVAPDPADYLFFAADAAPMVARIPFDRIERIDLRYVERPAVAETLVERRAVITSRGGAAIVGVLPAPGTGMDSGEGFTTALVLHTGHGGIREFPIPWRLSPDAPPVPASERVTRIEFR